MSSPRTTRSVTRAKYAAAGIPRPSLTAGNAIPALRTTASEYTVAPPSTSMPRILHPPGSYDFAISITAAMRRALQGRKSTSPPPLVPPTPALFTTTHSAPSTRTRQQQYQFLKKIRKRRALQQEGVAPLRLKAVLKHSSPSVVSAPVDVANIPHSKPGWIGDAAPRVEEKIYTVAELLQLGFEYQSWDGTDEMVIPTTAGRGFLHFIGRPADPPTCSSEQTWNNCNARAANVLRTVAFENGLYRCKKSRGDYPVVSAGMSFGGGPQQPYNVATAKCAESLVANADIRRIAHFQSNALATAAPKLYMHYNTVCNAVRARHPDLKKNFDNSVFPTIAFNCGSNVVTVAHVDSQNVAYGLCAITALGHYNHKTGGHIYFWELKLIVEFPPGATVLVPSAAITHGNTPIASNEQRASVTQYMSGALVRYVDYGFSAGTTLEATNPSKKRAIDQQGEQRWQGGLELHSVLSERQADIAASFTYTSV